MVSKFIGDVIATTICLASTFALMSCKIEGEELIAGLTASTAVAVLANSRADVERIIEKIELSDDEQAIVDIARARIAGAAGRFTALGSQDSYVTTAGVSMLAEHLLIDYQAALRETITAANAARDIVVAAIDNSDAVTPTERGILRKYWGALATLRPIAETVSEATSVYQPYIDLAKLLAVTIPAALPRRAP